MWEPPAPQGEAACMARGIREGDAQRKRHRTPGDRFKRANGVHDVLGPVLKGIDGSIQFPGCAVRSEVVAADSLDHADESVGVRGPATTVTPRERVRPTVVVAWLVATKELGGAKEDDGCARGQPSRVRVSGRRSKRRAWTCLAVTCVGEGAPRASRVARSARRTSSCVPMSAKSLAKLVCAQGAV